jgi:peptide/nickel transport system ATP-binding protein
MKLRLADITFTYPGSKHAVLEDMSLDVPGGVITGLAAPSGRGKSTLVKIAALALAPDCGRVILDGLAVTGTGFTAPQAVRRRIGLILQSPRNATNDRLRLRQIIAEPLSCRDGRSTPRPDEYASRIDELADLVQLTGDLLDRLPHQVSDGQLQRACLARALALDPDILLCDEPTAMLDAPTAAVIMRIITDRAAEGAAVLMASHDRALLNAVDARTHELGGKTGVGVRS